MKLQRKIADTEESWADSNALLAEYKSSRTSYNTALVQMKTARAEYLKVLQKVIRSKGMARQTKEQAHAEYKEISDFIAKHDWGDANLYSAKKIKATLDAREIFPDASVLNESDDAAHLEVVVPAASWEAYYSLTNNNGEFIDSSIETSDGISWKVSKNGYETLIENFDVNASKRTAKIPAEAKSFVEEYLQMYPDASKEEAMKMWQQFRIDSQGSKKTADYFSELDEVNKPNSAEEDIKKYEEDIEKGDKPSTSFNRIVDQPGPVTPDFLNLENDDEHYQRKERWEEND